MGNVLDKNAVLDRVKQFYKLKGNADLARFLGVSPNTVTNWYSRNSFDIDALYTYCVGCDFHWLLTGRDSILHHSKNSEETKLGCTPIATPISPAEESIIYKMYKDEKADWKAEKEKRETQIGHLQSELRAMEKELATFKAKYPEPSTSHPEGLGPSETAPHAPSHPHSPTSEHYHGSSLLPHQENQ